MHFKLLSCLVAFSLVGTIYAQTCDTSSSCTCMKDDLNPAGIMLGHEHAKGDWKVSYRYMHSSARGNMSEAHTVDDNTVFSNYLMSPKDMQMNMHMVMAMYGITNKLSVMTMFNYNTMSMGMNMLAGTTHVHGTGGGGQAHAMEMHTQGIGDVELYAMYEALSTNTHYAFVHGGVSVPTGNVNVKGAVNDAMYPGQRLPYMMQLGSGTVDFMPGATYLLRHNRLAIGVQATSIIRPFMNTNGYNLGNKLTLNTWVSYKWLNWLSNSIRIDDVYTSAIEGKDAQVSAVIEPAGNPTNYGGQNVSIYAGLNVYFNRTWLQNSKLLFEYGLPVYQYANGVQQKLQAGLYASWYFSF
jgi:hypothetical protein